VYKGSNCRTTFDGDITLWYNAGAAACFFPKGLHLFAFAFDANWHSCKALIFSIKTSQNIGVYCCVPSHTTTTNAAVMAYVLAT